VASAGYNIRGVGGRLPLFTELPRAAIPGNQAFGIRCSRKFPLNHSSISINTNRAGEILLVVLPMLLGAATTGLSYRAAFATGGAAFSTLSTRYLPYSLCPKFEYDREGDRMVVPNIECVRH
jgi:hypothetical protein